MRMSITMLLVLLAGGCAGDDPGQRTCTRTLYDTCQQEHDCASGNCHNFMAEGFQVCSTSCVAGDDTPCMTTLDGRKATCQAGICTPPAPNDCQLPRQ